MMPTKGRYRAARAAKISKRASTFNTKKTLNMLLKTPSQTDLAQCAIRGIGRDEPQCEHPGQVRCRTTYGANKFHFNMLSFL